MLNDEWPYHCLLHVRSSELFIFAIICLSVEQGQMERCPGFGDVDVAQRRSLGDAGTSPDIDRLSGAVC